MPISARVAKAFGPSAAMVLSLLIWALLVWTLWAMWN